MSAPGRGAREPGPCAAARTASGAPARVRIWLYVCAAAVFVVLVVGGITRLQHAGLSIVQWQPLAGALPPLTEQDWQDLFARYRASPQYLRVNSGMSLDAFRAIFWWEYAHRLLARLAGLIFLLPLIAFALRRQISLALGLRLAGIFALGALQGLLGWLMVASGLVAEPQVSPVRLCAHLALAWAIIALLLWQAWSLERRPPAHAPVPTAARAALALVVCAALAGAWVAGNGAGMVFNTFPLMDGALVPRTLLLLDPWYENLAHNPATIQFLHRVSAIGAACAVTALWWHTHRTAPRSPPRRAGALLIALLALQIGLGAATVLSAVALPWAAAHLATASLLFMAALTTLAALGGRFERAPIS